LRTCGSKLRGSLILLKKCWEEEEVEGYASYVLARKLKAIKEELKKWDGEVFGDIKLR